VLVAALEEAERDEVVDASELFNVWRDDPVAAPGGLHQEGRGSVAGGCGLVDRDRPAAPNVIFATGASRMVSGLPVWVGHAHYVNLGGDDVVFVYWEETSTGNRTTFYRVNGAADPTRLFSYEASWYSFGRLR
jgi:hypothetical protein